MDLRGPAVAADLVTGWRWRDDELGHSDHVRAHVGHEYVHAGHFLREHLAEVIPDGIPLGYLMPHRVEVGVPSAVLASEFNESVKIVYRGWSNPYVHSDMVRFA